MTVSDLRTPAVLIERSRLLNNITRLQTAANGHGIRVRPHTKTHKSPDIAKWQIQSGAIGICCAKLGEAEVMAAAGIQDIRLPYPLQPTNAARLIALLDRARISFIVDHLDVARGWSEAMTRAGRTVDVLVKIDVGFHRCGVDPATTDAASFVATVAGLPGLNVRGLLAHAGHGYHAASEDQLRTIASDEAALLVGLAEEVRSKGVAVDEISAGATPTARFSLEQAGLTEYRAGNYVFFDRTQVGLGAATLDECAMTVLATVVSKPAADRIILDCGSKTLSSDGARGFSPIKGHGAIFRSMTTGEPPDDSLLIERLSEEHATVRVAGRGTTLQPGDRVRVLPNHSCVVSNLMDELWLVDGQSVVQALRVAGRGKIS